MNILCIYNDEEESFLATHPEDELDDHAIYVAANFKEAERLIQNAGSFPPFGAVLADAWIPSGLNNGKNRWARDLEPLAFRSLIQGFGVFLPDHYEGEYECRRTVDDYHAVVVDASCMTVTGKRDWQALLGKVLDTIDTIPG